MDWRSSIDDFKVRNFQCSQRVGIEIKVCVLYFCISVVLCCEGDVARVRQEHAVFLHGSRDDLCFGHQLRHVVGGLQTKVGAVRRSGGRPGRRTGVRGWMHKDVGAYPRIGKNEADGVVDASGGDFVRIEQQRRDGETCRVDTAALISTSRRRIDAVQIPYRNELRVENAIRVVGLPSFIEFAVAAIDNEQVAVPLSSFAMIA
jgi:hypothetical protein